MDSRSMSLKQAGFTLVEVLIALVIISIALTALLKASGQQIETSTRLKEKNLSHWIAMQAVTMIQLNLVHLDPAGESTFATKFLNEQWYWRARVSPTTILHLQKMTILTSLHQAGPFLEAVHAFRYLP